MNTDHFFPWVGGVLTYLVVVLLLFDGVLQFISPPFFVETLAHRLSA